MSKFNELVTKLREIFQIDRPELDFGVYRILNARADEINDYLEHRLKEKVTEALSVKAKADAESTTKELMAELREEYGKRAFDDDGNLVDEEALASDAGKRLQEILSNSKGVADNENAVFSHLLTFFSRYYDQGDFISQRRYKGDTYAIPYAGEEVMLHWANKDQYYIKSGENFSNYSFKLEDGRVVHFRLVAADTAKDNRKDNDKDRLFVLTENRTIVRTDDEGDEYEDVIIPIEELSTTDADGNATTELIIRFDYKAVSKGTKQDKLISEAVTSALELDWVVSNWSGLASRAPTEKNPKRTLLEKHLINYTAKNTADYFIHKNLGKFLSGELDFYIKNEVMNLDDVQNADTFSDIEKNLRLIQCLRSVAGDVITFLSQLENFQKKLWTKKKFIVSSHFCITLDRVPEILYPAIVANEKQWQEWSKLGALSKNTASEALLKSNQHLVLDTSFFDSKFNQLLTNTIDNFDEDCEGLLISSDNFQGLNLLQEKYKNKVSATYIDPPYNTSASEIIYKNSYKHSSWLTLISDRLEIGKKLIESNSGFFCATIDDVEQKILSQLVEKTFGEVAGTVSIRIKPSGRPIPNGFALSHEYAIFARKNESNPIKRLKHSEEQLARYREVDGNGPFFWEMFRKAGSNSNRSNRPTMFYPFFVDKTTSKVHLAKAQYVEESESYKLLESRGENEVEVYPIKDDGTDGCWYFGYERAQAISDEFKAVIQDDGTYRIYYRRRPNAGVQPTTHWSDSKYSATEHGTALLKKLFGTQEVFSYPKSIHAVKDCLSVCGVSENKHSLILDYFAGSGTTAQAVIELNRADDGKRKYILIEQGEYFEKVTKPRVIKNIMSDEWKEGRIITPAINNSTCIKVIKLESYEDALNNLELKKPKMGLFDNNPEFKEDYLLKYALDVESRGSVLSIKDFKNPFDYSMKIAVDSAGAFEEKTIDLVETFNFLIGLKVASYEYQLDKGFVRVEGKLPTGENTLVIWRDCEKISYEKLREWENRLNIGTKDNPYDVIYINGDHNLPEIYSPTKEEGGETSVRVIRSIETEFLSRMFAEEEI